MSHSAAASTICSVMCLIQKVIKTFNNKLKVFEASDVEGRSSTQI